MEIKKESESIINFRAWSDYENLKALLLKEGVSERLFSKLYRTESIYVNHRPLNWNYSLIEGDIVTIVMEDEDLNCEREEMELDVVYEDLDIIVLDKPGNLVVHPTGQYLSGTLLNGLGYYFYKNGIKKKVRLINRLDKDTTGLIMVAKNQFSHGFISYAINSGLVQRRYLALVHGRFEKSSGIIESKIGRLGLEGIKKENQDSGKEARTHYKLIGSNKKYSLLELELETGRTHQIRVHLSSLGHPIVGDHLYGSEEDLAMCLNSNYLSFPQPRSKEPIVLRSSLPSHMEDLIFRNFQDLENL